MSVAAPLGRLLLDGAFLILGLVIVYEDWTLLRIRNSRLRIGFFLCLLGYAAIALGILFDRAQIPPGFYSAALLHLALSFLIAVVFWHADVWPAGDAKLFILAAFCLPLVKPALASPSRPLFLVMLINTFIPCFLFILVLLARWCLRYWMNGLLSLEAVRGSLARAWEGLERLKDLRPAHLKIGASFLSLFLLGSSLRFLLGRFMVSGTVPAAKTVLEGVGGGAFQGAALSALFYLIVFLYWDPIASSLSRRMGSVLVCLLVGYLGAGLALAPSLIAAHLRYALGMFAGLGGAYWLFRLVIEKGVEGLEGRKIEATLVQPGMVPLDLKLDQSFDWEAFGPLFRDGLSREQAELLRAWGESKPPAERMVTVAGGDAFAVWIVGGALLTLLLHKDVVRLGMGWVGV